MPKGGKKVKIQETALGFKGAIAKRSKTNRIIIHHSDSKTGNASVIHGWHLGRGWSGIGYHFVILPEGTIQRGRPEWGIGAHSGPGGNGDSIGICLIGKFEEYAPSEAQLKSLVWLIKEYLYPAYGQIKVMGHKDVMPTACPGKLFPWAELKKRLEEDEEVVGEVKVSVDGKTLTGVILKDNRSYAPVRALAEALGRKVDWDEKTKTVIIK